MFQDEAEKTNLPAIFLDVCYADNYFMRALMRTRLGLFVWLFFYFFSPRISSALTCGIASVFSLSLFLSFFCHRGRRLPLPRRRLVLSLAPPPYLGAAAPSASSPRLSRLTSQQMSSLCLGGIEAPPVAPFAYSPLPPVFTLSTFV